VQSAQALEPHRQHTRGITMIVLNFHMEIKVRVDHRGGLGVRPPVTLRPNAFRWIACLQSTTLDSNSCTLGVQPNFNRHPVE
jgi:hypothetical protein